MLDVLEKVDEKLAIEIAKKIPDGDFNRDYSKLNSEFSPLHLAAQKKFLNFTKETAQRLVVAQKIGVPAKDSYTTLHIAASNGDKELVRELKKYSYSR